MLKYMLIFILSISFLYSNEFKSEVNKMEINKKLEISEKEKKSQKSSELAEEGVLLSFLLELTNKLEKEKDSIEEISDKEIEDRYNSLENIVNFINEEKFISVKTNKDLEKKLTQLQIRIEANKKYNNNLAIKRDEIKILTINNRILFNDNINSLIEGRKKYIGESDIKKLISDNISLINSNNLKLYNKTYLSLVKKEGDKTKVEIKFIKNHQQYNKEKHLYLIINKYLLKNASKIVKSNFIIEKLNFDYLISTINNTPIIKDVNPLFEHYTKITIGNLILSLLLAIFIILLKVFILPLVIRMLESERNIKKDSKDIDDKLYQEKKEAKKKFRLYLTKSIKKPINIILVLFATEVFLKTIYNEQFNLDYILSVIKSVYSLLVIWTLYNFYSNYIEIYSDELFIKYPDLRSEMVIFINRIILILLICIGLAITLSNLGFNITALLGGLGVLGLGVSLAFKETFGQFLGSIYILFNKPFGPGDWIKTSAVEGTVIEIGMRGTRIRTFANGEITVPNSDLANTDILNWSRRKLGRRIKFELGITYDSNPEDFKKLIEDIRNMLVNHTGIAGEKTKLENISDKRKNKLLNLHNDIGVKKTLLVHFTSFGDSSKNIQIYCFSKSVDWEEWLEVKQDVLFKIEDLVYKNKCDFAYPTVTNDIKLPKNFKIS